MNPVFLGNWEDKEAQDIIEDFQLTWYALYDYDIIISFFDNIFSYGTIYILLTKGDEIYEIHRPMTSSYKPHKNEWLPKKVSLKDLKKTLDSDTMMCYSVLKIYLEKFIHEQETENGKAP